jgi:hypothetical protein
VWVLVPRPPPPPPPTHTHSVQCDDYPNGDSKQTVHKVWVSFADSTKVSAILQYIP